MKKASRAVGKKVPANKPTAAKKAPAKKPARKAEEQNRQLALVVTRLELVASTLTQIAAHLGEITEHLARLIPPAASATATPPMQEAPTRQAAGQHADDVEIGEPREE